MNHRLVLRYLSYIAVVCGITMLPSLILALFYREPSSAVSFALSAASCLVAALVLYGAGRNAPDTMYQRESLAFVGFSWVLAAALGALPFVFSGVLVNPIDAFFESMSGFTTTGSTVLVDIEAAPKSILFWRSMTQWLGGIGIAVLVVAVLPYLGAGGKQMFKLEAPGPESRSFRPRIRDTAKFLCQFYAALTVTLFLLLWAEGMSPFDSICHTFATVSTGGFSPRQASLGAYEGYLIPLTIVVFMVIAATNFGLYFAMLRRPHRAIWRDTEFRVYLAILMGGIGLITLNLMGVHGHPNEEIRTALEGGFEGTRYRNIETTDYAFIDALPMAMFQAASIMTTTGFVTEDFDLWPHFSRSLLLVLMFVGGCAGSTAGGFKVVRIVMLIKMAYWRLERSFRPKTIRVVRMGEEVVEEEIQRQVSGFFVLYLACFLMGTLLMSAFGLPFETSTTAVLATMNNIGPGLNLVGANVDFHLMPPATKVFLSFCMVLGRLEIFTICVLFLPTFWRSRWTK